MNVAVLLPDATVTVPAAGTLAAAVLLLAMFTVIPPVGAVVSRVTVAVEFVRPPVTLVGFNVTEVITGGVIVKVAVAEPFNVAVIVAVVVAATFLEVAVNVAVVAPAVTATLAGTVAEAEELASVTVRCAAVPAAGPLRVTVPVEFTTPPSTLVGFMVTEMTEGGMTVSVADFAAVVPIFAEIDTFVDTPTASGVTANVVDDASAGTVTVAGTVAMFVLLLVSVTTVPAAGADPFNVTVAVEV